MNKRVVIAKPRPGEVTDGTQECYDWPFDFEPYDIQKDLMKIIYKTLEEGRIGIFESPTGTGKSLSIICSALHWLVKNRGKHIKSCRDGEQSPPSETKLESHLKIPSWVKNFTESKSRREQEYFWNQLQDRRKRVEDYFKPAQLSNLLDSKNKSLRRTGERKKRRKLDSSSDAEDELSDYAPTNYESSDSNSFDQDCSSDSDSETSVDARDENDVRKIFFCSRTHSQLSQFINEVKRTKFGKEVPCVALGSRKQLCINPKVLKMGGTVPINEKCLDLQENAKKANREKDSPPSKSSCPFYNKSTIKRVRDLILYEAQDIESLQMIGKELNTCAYYSARAAVEDAELIALPYSMLLQSSSREALGISLKGNIVICDEAHNLIEAINQTYTVEVDIKNLANARRELEEYRSTYLSRLKAKNKLYLSHLILVLNGFLKYMQNTGENTLNTPGELFLKAKVDHINLFKLMRYIKNSELTRKLRGFARNHLKTIETSQMEEEKHPRSSLQNVYNFMLAMLNTDKNGKVLFLQDEKRMKFLMLNPSVHFQEVVDDAHSVILTGGTMQPTNDVILQLFGHVDRSFISLFSCGHVIPKENMLCAVVSKGPCNVSLELNFENRDKIEVMDEIGRCILNIAKIVPNGIVIFFPSYAYEERLYRRWSLSGMIKRLQSCKKLFREQKGQRNTDSLLANYSQTCLRGDRTHNGAILFSVVGGKLSEGINFKDHLARSVVMVGLPFPNKTDPELQVKLSYLNMEKYNSKEFYENQCMKAVNQCIGRSIRHASDYSSVILLDCRYKRQSILKKLPGWIASDIVMPDNFGKVFRQLHAYFKGKRDYK